MKPDGRRQIVGGRVIDDTAVFRPVTRSWPVVGGLRRLVGALAVAVAALSTADPATSAPALLFDVSSGEVLHAHDARMPWHPASLTKIMTTYVAFRAISTRRVGLNTTLTMSANAARQPPSKVGLPVGATIGLGDALQILMVKSANDLAVAVAEGVAGTEQAFIDMMNAEARRLGMVDTRFVNPHGLHDARQVTTARDMAILTRAIFRDFSQYAHIYRLRSIRFGGANMRSHNTLLHEYAGADGLKTGFVCASGFNIVATATRNGRRLAVVIMGSPNARVRHDYASYLLDRGFNERRGILSFTSSRATVSGVSRRGAARAPANMRPYVCGPRSRRQPIPASLASYGVTLPSATIVANPRVPLEVRSDIPLPRPSPRIGSRLLRGTAETVSAATTASGDAADVAAEIARYPAAPGVPLPRQRPFN